MRMCGVTDVIHCDVDGRSFLKVPEGRDSFFAHHIQTCSANLSPAYRVCFRE